MRRETAALRLHLLGALSLERGGMQVELPKSRKVRALLAYLALATRPVTRSSLCELLWDSPSDPRGELRWCLSRLRSVIDDPDRERVTTRADAVTLDLSDCEVDVLDIARALEDGVATLSLVELQRIALLFVGDLVEGLHVELSPQFSQWIGVERRRWYGHHVAVLREIIQRVAGSNSVITYAGQWLRIDPFDRTAHAALLAALVQHGRLREAEEHLATTIRAFEVEGLDWISIREAWRAAKSQGMPAIRIDASREVVSTPQTDPIGRRASICVMPFLEKGPLGLARSSLGDGLADDIITRLAKLRVLFVFARGTAFALADRNFGEEEIGHILDVDYCASGIVERRNGRIEVRVELVETHGSRIVWTDELECSADDALQGVDDLGNGIVASIAEEVETAERNRAILKPPNSLDAWEAYHRGLWHMYRFNSADNERAEHFFRVSTQLDPTFARAHAGLSFTHFQNAFLHRCHERTLHADRAYESAGQSLLADDRDPAAHWAMGRALWLRGRESDSLTELATSVDLSPNFALGHYAVGFVHCQSGDAGIAIGSTDHSRRLSPFDPLLFAMLATRALAHVRRGEYEDAASWAVKAAARPNAHIHILAIAAHCLAVAGRVDEARSFASAIRSRMAGYGIENFLGSFRFAPEAQVVFRHAASRIGFT